MPTQKNVEKGIPVNSGNRKHLLHKEITDLLHTEAGVLIELVQGRA